MANDNLPATQEKNPVKALFNRDEVKNKFHELLGKRAASFMTSVLQIVTQNELLKHADPASIYQAAAVAATLDLPLNNNLGFAYIVPYNQSYKDAQGKWQKKQVAQFQMGYKGFIQLAQRSGQFKTLSSTPIYEGQILESNPLTGYQFDFSKKDSDTVLGYAAYFKLINGFEATLYMTVEQIKKHGGKYSKTFTNDKGLWNTDFEAMATKTVIKLLLSKFAPLSVEMQKSVIADQGFIKDAETMDVSYVDNEPVAIDHEGERLKLMIEDATTVEDLEALQPHIKPEQVELFNQKFQEVTSELQ